jgi:hypothetical protein
MTRAHYILLAIVSLTIYGFGFLNGYLLCVGMQP